MLLSDKTAAITTFWHAGSDSCTVGMELYDAPGEIIVTCEILPFMTEYDADAPQPPPPTNVRVPAEPLQPFPADRTVSEAMLDVKVSVELRNQVSRDGRAAREPASAKKSTSLFTIGILIQPVTNEGCLI